jgi:PAS domain S-box-containing protein
MPRPLRVLIIEDCEADADLMVRQLRAGGFEPHAERVQTAGALRAALRHETWEVILSDFHLPSFNGREALELAREINPDIPFILVAGAIGEETAAELMRAGADDYLMKGNLTRLAPAVERALREAQTRRQRREIERALQESVERFRTIAQATSDAVWDWDITNNRVWWGEGVATVFGHSPEEAAAGVDWWRERIDPADRDRVMNSLHATIQRGIRNWQSRYRWQRGDGSYAHVSDHGYLLYDEAGRPRRMLGAMLDETERRQAEAQIEEQRRRLQALFELSLDAIVMTDSTGRYVDVNPAACELLGYSRAELLGMAVPDVTDPQELPRFQPLWRQFLETGTLSGEYLVRRKDGATRVVEFRAVANILPDLHLSVMRDITERRRTREALRASEERFQGFMENSPLIAFIKDEAGRYVYVNRHLAELFGRPASEWLGRAGPEIWPAEVAAQYQQNDRAALESGRTLVTTETALMPGGRRTEWLMMRFTIRDAQGQRLLGGAGVDITEQKQAESRLQRSRERLRALAARLQAVREEERAHIAREVHDELGQALTGLKLELALLGNEALAGRDQRAARKIRRRLDKLAGLLDQTVHAVRRISTELRPGVLDDFGLAAAIEWQTAEFQKRTGIRCRVNVAGKDVSFLDQRRATAVFRIFQEILTNVARHAGATRLSVELAERDGSLWLQVRDNGRGITPEEVAAPQSLGLLGMQERAQVFGGTVSITGEAGAGTTVTTRIPLGEATT